MNKIDKERLQVRSVPKFINYLLLRIRDGYPITVEEQIDTYRVYTDFCETNKLDMLFEQSFYRERYARGKKSRPIYDKGKGKSYRIRDLSPTYLEQALLGWVDSGTETQFIASIGGKRIQVSIRLDELVDSTTLEEANKIIE